MSIVLIIAGIVLLLLGIVGLTGNSGKSKDNTSSTPTSALSQNAISKDNAFENSTSSTSDNEETPHSDSDNLTSKDIAKERGNEFEGFVADMFSPKNGFVLKEWNQGTTSPDGNYAEDELKPDLKIERIREDKNLAFWVECKYRTSLNSKYPLFREYQIKRYSGHQRETRLKVLMVIGIGGQPSAPSKVYIIPLDTVKATPLNNAEDFAPFELKNPKTGAAHYIDNYFATVFRKSKK